MDYAQLSRLCCLPDDTSKGHVELSLSGLPTQLRFLRLIILIASLYGVIWILESAVEADYPLFSRAKVDDLPTRVIQFHTSLLHDVGPVTRKTLCGYLVDHERECLQTHVHLGHTNVHDC